MIIKLFGALIIIVSCAGFGFCINAKNKLKINELKNMRTCLDIMEREMCMSFKTLFDAIEIIQDDSSKINKQLFNEILKYRNNNETLIDSEKMTDILNKFSNLYDSKDIKIIKGLTNFIRCENTETLKEIFFKIKLDLDDRISEVSENIKNKRVFEKLSVYIGIIISVFFI